MPLVFQQDINENSKLAFWKVEEPLSFFKTSGFETRSIRHDDRKRMYAAGRFLLHHTFPHLDPESVVVLPNGKPVASHADFHFSISHASHAVVVIGSNKPIGVDLEFDAAKAHRLSEKFCNHVETVLGQSCFHESMEDFHLMLWTLKEAAYKCYGQAGIRFSEQIRLTEMQKTASGFETAIHIYPNNADPVELQGSSRFVEGGWLSWVCQDLL